MVGCVSMAAGISEVGGSGTSRKGGVWWVAG